MEVAPGIVAMDRQSFEDVGESENLMLEMLATDIDLSNEDLDDAEHITHMEPPRMRVCK